VQRFSNFLTMVADEGWREGSDSSSTPSFSAKRKKKKKRRKKRGIHAMLCESLLIDLGQADRQPRVLLCGVVVRGKSADGASLHCNYWGRVAGAGELERGWCAVIGTQVPFPALSTVSWERENEATSRLHAVLGVCERCNLCRCNSALALTLALWCVSRAPSSRSCPLVAGYGFRLVCRRRRVYACERACVAALFFPLSFVAFPKPQGYS
jgi:hypothetical protein